MRMVYFANIVDDATRERRHITSDSPAAFRKVQGIALAWATTGNEFRVVSDGRGRISGRGSLEIFGSSEQRVDSNLTIWYGWLIHVRAIAHVVSAASLCMLALRQCNPTDTVAVFYNAEPHCVPTLIALRLRGVACMIDVEDGLDLEWNTLRGVLYGLSQKLFHFACIGGFAASNRLSQQLAGRPCLAVQGVASEPATAASRRWDTPQLHVVLSGTLSKDTGAELFAATVRELIRDPAFVTAHPIRFTVCGQGSHLEELEELASNCGSDILRVLGRLSFDDYRALLDEAHVGLSLKLPDTHYGNSTFPSKTFELVSSGLFLVSTTVSDVPRLFSREDCEFIDEPSPSSLAKALLALERDREHLKTRAERATRRLHASMGPRAVGERMLAHVTAVLRDKIEG